MDSIISRIKLPFICNSTDIGVELVTLSSTDSFGLCVSVLRVVAAAGGLAIAAMGLWDYRVRRSKDKLCDKPLPPGKSGVPWLGETAPFVADGRHYFRSRIQKHGQVFRSHLIGEPYVVVCGARNVRKILASEGDLVRNNPAPAASVLFGEGSLGKISGERHTRQYKAIRGAFNSKTLSSFNGRIAEMLHERISDWCQKGRILAVPECKKMIFEIGSEVVLGMRFGSEDTKKLLKEFEVFSDNFFTIFTHNLPGTSFRRALKARERIMKIMHANDVSESCVLNLLIDIEQSNDGSSNNPDAYDNALEVFFAMTSTTASACCALITLLNDRPDVIAHVRHEIAAHCRKEEVLNHRHLDFSKMAGSMSYVNAVVKEVLRLRPPVAGGFRKAIKTFELDGFQIPKDWAILYCITDTHENAPNYNPEFTPEDWLSRSDQTSSTNLPGEDCADDVISSDSSCPFKDTVAAAPSSDVFVTSSDADSANNSAEITPGNSRETATSCKRDTYHYLPFGAGSRACPGQEFAKQLLRLLLVEMCMSTVWELENPNYKLKSAPFPFADDDLPLKIEHRGW